MLKARIQKTSNKKLFKQLSIVIGKNYCLKEMDFLLNLLVEEISLKNNKYQENSVINIKLELLDKDTKILRWYKENVELNSYLEYISSDILENTLNKENSLLKSLIQRDLNQDPEVNEEDKEEFFILYDESYDYQDDSKNKTVLKKLPSFFNFGKKTNDLNINTSSEDKVEIENIIEEKETELNNFNDNQSDNNSTINSDFEEIEPQFDDYQIEEDFNVKSENKNSNEEEIVELKDFKENQDTKIHNTYTLPINIPEYVYKEPIKKASETPLDDLREDFIFTREIEREQYRKTLYENINNKINQKDSELNSDFERKIILFKEESELTDEEIGIIEKEKRDELDKQLIDFKECEEENKEKKLLLIKEEYEIKIREKTQELENELDEKVLEQISENEKMINDYIISRLQTHDELVELDIKDLTNKFNIKKKEILNLELSKAETDLNTKLQQFDKETFSQLNTKIIDFKQEIVAEQLRQNQKVKLENEQLKLKATLKKAKQREDEVEKAREEAKIREFKVKEEKEKARILELELDKEKQKYKNKLLIETERENDLKQRELDMLSLKNELVADKDNEKIRKNTDNKNILYKSIFLILLSCLIVASLITYGIKTYMDIQQSNKIETQNKKENLDSLLSKNEYSKAIKLYPNNAIEITNHAYKNKSEHGLESIINTTDDTQAKIYKGILEKDSERTTDLYMKNKYKIKLSDNDLEQIGLLMLDDNEVEQAIDINKNLKSKKLGQKIKDYKILSQYKEKKTKQVKEDK